MIYDRTSLIGSSLTPRTDDRDPDKFYRVLNEENEESLGEEKRWGRFAETENCHSQTSTFQREKLGTRART